MATPSKNDRKKSHKQSLRPEKTTRAATNSEREAEFAAGERHPAPAGVDAQNVQIARQTSESAPSTKRGLTIFTIGHSTHAIEEFIGLLKNYRVEQLVDVRTVPKSRHVPQFNSEALAESLSKQGIGYVHLKALGGLRHAKKDSVNAGWRNASFRGYADYMSTEEFAQGINRLIDLAKVKRTVIMCAEAVPWRCHRSLIGDALLVQGIAAEDIMSATSARPHKLTEFARVDGQQITYPADKNLELFSAPPAENQ